MRRGSLQQYWAMVTMAPAATVSSKCWNYHPTRSSGLPNVRRPHTAQPSMDRAQAKISSFRLSLRLIAIYAIMCLFWVGFADWLAPNIISAAYDERNLSILNWVFQGRSFPVEHYVDRWNVIAAAALLAAVLHLVIVLFIRS